MSGVSGMTVASGAAAGDAGSSVQANGLSWIRRADMGGREEEEDGRRCCC